MRVLWGPALRDKSNPYAPFRQSPHKERGAIHGKLKPLRILRVQIEENRDRLILIAGILPNLQLAGMCGRAPVDVA